IVGVRDEFDVPAGPRIFNGRCTPTDDSLFVSSKRGPAVQLIEGLGERAGRFILQALNDAFEACVFSWVKVDEISAWCEDRVLQGLEVLSHIPQNRVDHVGSRSSSGFR